MISKLQAIWHVLRGRSVMYRVVAGWDAEDRSKFVAHYKGSGLAFIENEWVGWSPDPDRCASVETRKEALARMQAMPHIVDPETGDSWETLI